MRNHNKREIEIIANTFRQAIEKACDDGRFTKYPFNAFPYECCDDTSMLLGRYFLERGYECNLIRGKYNEACTQFHKAITLCVTENNTKQLDFVHQHLGKCFIEMGMYAHAELQLQTALKLREKKGNEALINSTVKALDLLTKLERDV